MIDWTKPIETVPCAINPLPVRCVCVGFKRGDAQVLILADWFDSEQRRDEDNYCDDPDDEPWVANRTTGEIEFFDDFCIRLRNVEGTE